jgi:hypothetical protein
MIIGETYTKVQKSVNRSQEEVASVENYAFSGSTLKAFLFYFIFILYGSNF